MIDYGPYNRRVRSKRLSDGGRVLALNGKLRLGQRIRRTTSRRTRVVIRFVLVSGY